MAAGSAQAQPPLILVVEDDLAIRLSIRVACEKAGYRVAEAVTGREALARAASLHPDLVLLDLMLPELSGLDVHRALRARDPALPIIMVTAKGEEFDRVQGLELGADDYVTKPFSPRELVARVGTVLRRAQRAGNGASAPAEALRYGDLLIDPTAREVSLDGRRLDLTRTEFDLLEALARQPGRALTRAQLVQTVWGYQDEGGTRLLDSHIRNLRQKLDRPFIATVRDVGYKFMPPEG